MRESYTVSRRVWPNSAGTSAGYAGPFSPRVAGWRHYDFMKYLRIAVVLPVLFVSFFLPLETFAQSDDSRLDKLEDRVSYLEYEVYSNGAVGLAVFLCASLCALWAQQTGRNAWLWFFLGAFFNFITLLVLLHKNSNDKRLR